jgi:hypothetical protein
MFLGVVAEQEIVPYKKEEKSRKFLIHIADNPLNDFVELPEHLYGINYSGIIAGAIRGALAAVLCPAHFIDSLDSIMQIYKGSTQRG